MTVALAGEPVTIAYDGSNLADGDQAYWVPLSSPSCDAESGVGSSDIRASRGVHVLPKVGSRDTVVG
jgi:hypothetical protein